MNKNTIILLFALFLEIALLTFFRGIAGVYVSPIILTLVSLFIGIYPIIIAKNNKNIYKKESKTLKSNPLISILLFVAGSFVSIIIFRNIIITNEINYKISDVIPTVQILSERFINGEFPYTIITAFGNILPPTYLPFQWLPFCISSYFNFDPRWIALSIWLISIAVFSFVVFKNKSTLASKIIFTISPFLILLIFMLEFPSMFANTFEIMLVGYYIILTLSIFSNSNLLRAGGLILPLLSRYSLIFWVPVYIIILFFSEKKKNSIIISAVTIGLIIFLYVVPFLSKDLEIFSKGYNYYTEAALGEWTAQEWQSEGSKPFHLFRGIGFASFYYDFYQGELQDKLTALKNTHLILSLLTITLCGLLFIRFKKFIDYRLYSLLSLKIYFVFFYSFIQVPYIYLFIIPVFLSMIIVYFTFNKTQFQKF